MSWTEIKHALNSSLGTDKFRSLDILQLERTLVDRYSKDSLIWAMTQYGIGAAFNQMYQLRSDMLHNCSTIDEIYNSNEAIRACLNNSETVELLYLYPYLDFKNKIRSTYTLSKCISENLINNVYFIGDTVKINLTGYGDVDFVMIDKNYDGEGTSCWMTVNTLFSKNISLGSWYSWTGEVKTSIIEVSDKFTDKNILDSLQIVTRKYASLDSYNGDKSVELNSKTWVPSANQMKIDNSILEDRVLEYYKNHSKIRNNDYTCLRRGYSKSGAYNHYYTFYYVNKNGGLSSQYAEGSSAAYNSKYTLGVPIAITIKG